MAKKNSRKKTRGTKKKVSSTKASSKKVSPKKNTRKKNAGKAGSKKTPAAKTRNAKKSSKRSHAKQGTESQTSETGKTRAPEDPAMGGPPHDTPPEDPKPARLPDDPSRWTRDNWAFDPTKDEPWEDPSILRRRIGTEEELEAVADAIVENHRLVCTDPEGNERVIVQDTFLGNGTLTRYARIEELRDLVEAVQRHPSVRLARAQWEKDDDGVLRVTRRWVTDGNGRECPNEEETILRLRGCVVDSCKVSNFTIGVYLNVSARFIGEANFNPSIFTGGADFHQTHFGWIASFLAARFAKEALFSKVCFDEDADFGMACFAGNVNFNGARFDEEVNFHRTRFNEETSFSGICFDEKVCFNEVHFDKTVDFCKACFNEKASFHEAVCSTTVSFTRATVRHTLLLTHARFHRPLRLDDLRVTGCSWQGKEDLEDAPAPGVYLSESISLERIVLRGAWFAPNTRLGVHGLLCLGDSTLELDIETIRPMQRARRIARRGGRNSLRRRLRAILHDFLHYLGFVSPPPFVCNEDTRDPDALRRGARDWELLAHNAGRQSGTDEIEDWSRWRAHELRRRADLIERMRTLTKLPPPPAVAQGTPLARFILREYVDLIAVMQAVLSAFGGLVMRDVLWCWLIERTMVGYMLDPRRAVVSGGVLVLLCTAIYGLFANSRTISYMGELPEGYADAIEYWHAPDLWGVDLSPLYFSLMTFVTLGYGDFAPIGWFKLVAAGEALLGVTLLALFTVAWGRRMIR